MRPEPVIDRAANRLRRRRSRAAALASLSTMLVATGCADDSQTPALRAVLSDTELAAVHDICGLLRDARNQRTDVINATVREINGAEPEQRYVMLHDGFDSMAVEVETFAVVVEESPAFDRLPEGGLLREQLRMGTTAALAELDAEQQRFVDNAPSIADDAVQGAVGELFNSVEKVNSLVRPNPDVLERRGARQAFLDVDDCEHVIESFVIDPVGAVVPEADG